MNENGNGNLRELRLQFREAANDIQKRLTTLETQMKIIAYVGTLFGTIITGVTILLIIGVLR